MSGVYQYHLGKIDRLKVNKVIKLARRYQTKMKVDSAIAEALKVLQLKLNPAEYEYVLDMWGEDL